MDSGGGTPVDIRMNDVRRGLTFGVAKAEAVNVGDLVHHREEAVEYP